MTKGSEHQLEARLLGAVQRAGLVARAHARESERRATLHPAVVDALRSEGLFLTAAPPEVGGFGAEGGTQLRVYEAMAHADPSAGWSLMIGATLSGMLGAYLPDDAARAIFRERAVVAAGLQVPMGSARPVPGGFVVTGRWGFGSGIHHADWVFTAARVEGPAEAGPPAFVHVALPVESVSVESTWDTAFLSGSGSEHYHVDEVFVPEAYTCAYPNAARQRGGAFFDLPFVALVAPGHLGFALGVARRALEEAAALAPARFMAWPAEPLAAQSSFRVALGRQQAALDAARALAEAVVAQCCARVTGGDALTPADWSAVRAAIPYVTEVAADVCTFAFRAGGATALFAGAPVERCFRDIHGATQHIAATDDGYDYAARVLMDEAPFHPLLVPRMPAAPAAAGSQLPR